MDHQRSARATGPELAPNLTGLVQACKDEPDDDGLRLILADYLEDHNEPERAEFFRLSLQVDRPSIEPASQAGIHARLAQLRHQHQTRWLGPLARLKGNVGFHRGMISVRARMQEFRRPCVVADLEAVSPWTERLYLEFGRQTMPVEFANLPCAGAFTHLDLTHDALAREYLKGVARSPLAPNLIGLRVRPRESSNSPLLGLVEKGSQLNSLRLLSVWGRISRVEMQGLLAGPFATQLRVLSLTGAGLSRSTLNELARAESLASLEQLHLACSFQGADGCALLKSPHLHRLHTLRCYGTHLNDTFGVALAQSPLLANVRVLDLHRNAFTDAMLIALAESPHVVNLEELNLSGNVEITDVGVQALANSPHLVNLRHLDLSCGTFSQETLGKESARALARSTTLTRLESLSFQGNRQIGATGLQAFFHAANLPALRDLNLEGISLTRRCIETLANSSLGANLRRLRLGEEGLTDESVEILAHSPTFRNLEALEMRLTKIGNRGLQALAESTTLERLAWLGVDLPSDPEHRVASLVAGTGLPALTFLTLTGEPSQIPAILKSFQNAPGNRVPFFLAARHFYRSPSMLFHATPGFPVELPLE